MQQIATGELLAAPGLPSRRELARLPGAGLARFVDY
jgi:DNA-binding transcriptional regulator YhcF (GntR family)